MDPGRGELLRRRPGRDREITQPRRVRRRRRRSRMQGPLLHRRRPRRDPLPRPGRQLRRPHHREPAPQQPRHHQRGRLRTLDDTGAQLLFRFVAAAYERRALGIGSHWPFDQWGRFLPSTPRPSACWTGSCITRSWWSPKESRSGCARHGPRREDASPRTENHRGMGTFTWPPAATSTWPLTTGPGRVTSRSRTSWAGPTSRSAPASPSAATRPWSTARSHFAGTPGSLITRPSTVVRLRGQNPAAERGGPAAAAPPPSWPRALRAVRAWLSPWIALQRWWPAWSKAPPPPQLQALIDSVAAGCGLHLYIPN